MNLEKRILIADDDPVSRSIFGDIVSGLGYKIVTAENGQDAWQILKKDPKISIALIDWIMPKMDGPTLCAKIKNQIFDRYVYSIMITAKDEKEDLIKGMDAGADEFISKPVHEGELISRLRAGERMLAYEHKLRAEKARADELLANILPPAIALRLKASDSNIADIFPSSSIMFLDIVGFTEWCLRMEAKAMVEQLNMLFAIFDEEIEKYGLEKIKSVGDAYLVAGGVPDAMNDHAPAMARLALGIQGRIAEMNKHRLQPWGIRTGITTGAVVGGVIGNKRFIYDVWGDTVNNASRLEAAAETNQILISEATYELLANQFDCELVGEMELKGLSKQNVWKLVREKTVSKDTAGAYG
jgi:class 3 adenylate cyclase